MLDAFIISGYAIGILALVIGVLYGIYKEFKGD